MAPWGRSYLGWIFAKTLLPTHKQGVDNTGKIYLAAIVASCRYKGIIQIQSLLPQGEKLLSLEQKQELFLASDLDYCANQQVHAH